MQQRAHALMHIVGGRQLPPRVLHALQGGERLRRQRVLAAELTLLLGVDVPCQVVEKRPARVGQLALHGQVEWESPCALSTCRRWCRYA